jgi:SSS family solute:Na+ symporter
MNAALIGVSLVYLAALAAAGLVPRRRGGGLEGYFFASRGLGSAPVALSLTMAWFGASSTLVTADEAWRTGVSALWYVAAPAVLTLGVIFVLAGRGRSAAAATLPGLLESRYGPGARIAATGLIVWYMTLLAASQAMAARFLLSALFPGSGTLEFGLAVAVVLAYSLAGGFPAIVRTHVLQFCVLAAGLTAALVFLLGSTSLDAAAQTAARFGREGFFDVFRAGGRGILAALSFTLAWTVSPVAWQRIRAARSTAAARRATLAAAALLGGLYAAVIMIGLLLVVRFPEIQGTGTPILTRFIASGSPPVLGGLLFAGVLAAILSTWDAAVNAGALALVGEGKLGTQYKFRDELSGNCIVSPIFFSRAAGAAIALASLLIALRLRGILQTLGLSSLVMAQGLFVPAAGALLLKKRSPLAGGLALALGGGSAFLSFLVEAGLARLPLPIWPYSLPFGLGLSLAGFLLGMIGDAWRLKKWGT